MRSVRAIWTMSMNASALPWLLLLAVIFVDLTPVGSIHVHRVRSDSDAHFVNVTERGNASKTNATISQHSPLSALSPSIMSILDEKKYKHLEVKRGFTYRYYADVTDKTKPTLLFIHGFPSSSIDWHRQITFFASKGYGVICPDLLGAGESSKPVEIEAYNRNALAEDLIEILNHEGIPHAIGVGHDWGSGILARLSTNYQDRFIGFVWVTVPFIPPYTTPFDLDQVNAQMKETLGYESYAYWNFFIDKDAPGIMIKNIDSFMELLYPRDADLWLTYMVVPNKTEEFLRGNMKPGLPTYLTDLEYHAIRSDILNGNMAARLNMYKSQVKSIDLEDNMQIPQSSWTIQKPSILFACSKEVIWPPKLAVPTMNKWGTDVEVVSMDTGHWAFLEDANRLNEELKRWIDAKF
jgi:soluble epoxide hydrolase/lipid-phosphate phosphatase